MFLIVIKSLNSDLRIISEFGSQLIKVYYYCGWLTFAYKCACILEMHFCDFEVFTFHNK